MEKTKGLQYALVLVLITSAILLGWTTYLERQLHNKQAAFSSAVASVKSDAEAKQVIQSFLIDTHTRNLQNSASADGSCSWLCNGAK